MHPKVESAAMPRNGELTLQWQHIKHFTAHKDNIPLPLIFTVGEFGPADCFLHPLQFWQRLSASDMNEHRESSSKRSESSKENLSPSSHSANISSITSAVWRPESSNWTCLWASVVLRKWHSLRGRGNSHSTQTPCEVPQESLCFLKM